MEPNNSPRKRPKQACKNCRRKKARCPGERPVCSFCERLRQHCEYDEVVNARPKSKVLSHQTKASKLAERVSELETRLCTLTHSSKKHLNQEATEQPQIPSSSASSWDHLVEGNENVSATLSVSDDTNSSSKFRTFPPKQVILGAVENYFTAFHNYPLTFFYEETFRDDLSNDTLPSYLLLAIVANTAHLSDDLWYNNSQTVAAVIISQCAWAQILSDIIPNEASNDIAVVQAVALLALFDIRLGIYGTAIMKLRMAVSLAQTLLLTKEPDLKLTLQRQEERRYVFWSLYVMDKVAAFYLAAPSILGDDCSTKLPEDFDDFRSSLTNNMPTLQNAKHRPKGIRGSFAKLIVSASLVGVLSALSEDKVICPNGLTQELHSNLIAYVDELSWTLLDELPPLNNNDVSHGTLSDRTAYECSVSLQELFARCFLHSILICLNHPFFTRRFILHDHRNIEFWNRTDALCLKHAESFGKWLHSAQFQSTISQNHLFPGYMIFNVGLIHCLFMHAPDNYIASRSKVLYQQCRTALYQQGFSMPGQYAQPFLEVLEFLSENPGVSSFLTDAIWPFRTPKSSSPNLWQFLNFQWLCENLGLDTAADEVRIRRSMEMMPSQSNSKRHSTVTITSTSMSSLDHRGSPSFPATPQNNSSVLVLQPTGQSWDSIAPLNNANDIFSVHRNQNASLPDMVNYNFTFQGKPSGDSYHTHSSLESNFSMSLPSENTRLTDCQHPDSIMSESQSPHSRNFSFPPAFTEWDEAFRQKYKYNNMQDNWMY